MYAQRAGARNVVMNAVVVGGTDGDVYIALSGTEKVPIDYSQSARVVYSEHDVERSTWPVCFLTCQHISA